jgi:hypothetical protein
MVETHKMLADAPSWTWLTRQGLRHCDLPYVPCTPAAATLAHRQAVNAVRLLIEDRPGTNGWIWQSERLLRTRLPANSRGARRPHVPDAVILPEHDRPEGQVAVEVELSRKGPERLASILAELVEQYTSVWYFAAPEAERALMQAVTNLEPHQRKHVRLYTLAGEDRSL